MAKQVQDMSGGYLDITDADESADRVVQDMSGGYVDMSEGAGGGGGSTQSLMQISG